MTSPTLHSDSHSTRRRDASPLVPRRPRWWKALRRVVARALRPGLAPIHRRLRRIERVVAHGRRRVWRGGLDGGLWPADSLGQDRYALHRLGSELGYWCDFFRDPSIHPGLSRSDDPARVILGWQRGRLLELARCLGLPDEQALDAWCLAQRVVEIGGGPVPAVAAARWRAAVAADPLADAYAAERLSPPSPTYVPLVALGEALPLPSASWDLVICENCLDHVDDPLAVLLEVRRLLHPGGHLWLLVDLDGPADWLHPHPMTLERIRSLLAAAGLSIAFERTLAEHASRGGAGGEYRALAVKHRGARNLEGTPATAGSQVETKVGGLSAHAPTGTDLDPASSR